MQGCGACAAILRQLFAGLIVNAIRWDSFRLADTEVDGQALNALRMPQPQFFGRMAKP